MVHSRGRAFRCPALIGPRRCGTRYRVRRSVGGLGAPITTETRCLTAIQIPGNPLRSFDISWVDADRSDTT